MNRIIIIFITVILLSAINYAQTLKIGLASGALTMDPHARDEIATISILSNISNNLPKISHNLES